MPILHRYPIFYHSTFSIGLFSQGRKEIYKYFYLFTRCLHTICYNTRPLVLYKRLMTHTQREENLIKYHWHVTTEPHTSRYNNTTLWNIKRCTMYMKAYNTKVNSDTSYHKRLCWKRNKPQFLLLAAMKSTGKEECVQCSSFVKKRWCTVP